MDTKTIFFLGKPGSGKGTQAARLAERTGWRVFGSGDQLRSIAKDDTPVGRKTGFEIDQGILSPPWFVEYLYLRIALTIPAEESVIFDGFNRKIEEAELLFAASEYLERPFTVVHIAVSDEEVHRRLDSRKGELGRADDHHVEMRLQEYARYTEKALEVFRKGGVCIEVNGEQDPDLVAEEVARVLKIAP